MEAIPLSEAIRRAVDRLAAAGVESPRADAELLAAFALGVQRSSLVLLKELPPLAAELFVELIAERSRRTPLQHLTGTAPFRYLELAVGPGVFVPRPETESLVEWGLDQLRATGVATPLVVDLCAGSGAIALSFAHEYPSARVWAVEQDEHAVAWLGRNAQRREAAGDPPVQIIHADATAPQTLAELDGSVDLVVSNPPYIPVGASVATEARDHDPPTALWGGKDGLDVVRGVAAAAGRLLRTGGWFGFEHGEQQAEMLMKLLAKDPQWTDCANRSDLAGRPRFTVARRAHGSRSH